MRYYKTALGFVCALAVVALLQLPLPWWLSLCLAILIVVNTIEHIRRLLPSMANFVYLAGRSYRWVGSNGQEWIVNVCDDSVITSFFISLHCRSLETPARSRHLNAFYGDPAWERLQRVARQLRFTP